MGDVKFMVGSAGVSTADVLGIAGIAVAIVGIGVAVFYGRRALRPPKRLIQWHYEATPLISGDHAQYHDAIEVRVLGQRVSDPYLGKLIVENSGRHDIDSNSFDQGRSIRFNVHHARKTGTFLELEHNPPGLRVDGNSIMIGPELLPSKSRWTVSFIADGRPSVRLSDSHLINVKIQEKSAGGERTRINETNVAALIAGGATVGAALGSALVVFFTH